MNSKLNILQKILLTNHSAKEEFFFSEKETNEKETADFSPTSEVISIRLNSRFLKELNLLTDKLKLSRNQIIIAALYHFIKNEINIKEL